MSKKERFETEVVPAYVDRINDYENSKKEVIQELAERIKAEDLVPDVMICEYIKIIMKRFRAPVDNRTIERALPETFKRKNVMVDQRQTPPVDDKKVIEQTTTGEHNVRPFNYPSDKGPAEIDLTTKEEMDREREEMADGLELNSNEAIKELEEQRERDRETIKTMQKQIDDLEKDNQRLLANTLDAETARKATKQDFDKLKERTEELEEALKKSIQKEGFAPASQLPKMPQADSLWLPADDAVILFAHLRKAKDEAIGNWQQKRKILIEWEANTGRVTGARLADV